MKECFFIPDSVDICPACGGNLEFRGTLARCPNCERDFQREQDVHSANELPFRRRAIAAHEKLWWIPDAVRFCREFLSLPNVDTISVEEYKAARLVADGQPYPVPDRLYTVEQWRKDRTLCAIPGQEVTKDIYYDQFEVLPPFRLPRCPRTAGYNAGFQVSEAACSHPICDKMLYSTYGRRDGKYYYLGLLPADDDPYCFI